MRLQRRNASSAPRAHSFDAAHVDPSKDEPPTISARTQRECVRAPCACASTAPEMHCAALRAPSQQSSKVQSLSCHCDRLFSRDSGLAFARMCSREVTVEMSRAPPPDSRNWVWLEISTLDSHLPRTSPYLYLAFETPPATELAHSTRTHRPVDVLDSLRKRFREFGLVSCVHACRYPGAGCCFCAI